MYWKEYIFIQIAFNNALIDEALRNWNPAVKVKSSLNLALLASDKLTGSQKFIFFFLPFLSLPFLCANHVHVTQEAMVPMENWFSPASWNNTGSVTAGQPVEKPASGKSSASYLRKEQWNGKEKKVWLEQLFQQWLLCSLINTDTQCILLSWDVFITSLTK